MCLSECKAVELQLLTSYHTQECCLIELYTWNFRDKGTEGCSCVLLCTGEKKVTTVRVQYIKLILTSGGWVWYCRRILIKIELNNCWNFQKMLQFLLLLHRFYFVGFGEVGVVKTIKHPRYILTFSVDTRRTRFPGYLLGMLLLMEKGIPQTNATIIISGKKCFRVLH